MSASCPVCGDFAGSQSSVEAHISGSTTGGHQGAVGEDYRGSIDGGQSRLWGYAAIVVVVVVLTIAENRSDGGETEPEAPDEEGDTVLVDPAVLAQGGGR